MELTREEIQSYVEKIKKEGCGSSLIPDWITYGTSTRPGKQLFLLTAEGEKKIREESPVTAELIRPYYSEEYFRTGITTPVSCWRENRRRPPCAISGRTCGRKGKRRRPAFSCPPRCGGRGECG